ACRPWITTTAAPTAAQRPGPTTPSPASAASTRAAASSCSATAASASSASRWPRTPTAPCPPLPAAKSPATSDGPGVAPALTEFSLLPPKLPGQRADQYPSAGAADGYELVPVIRPGGAP